MTSFGNPAAIGHARSPRVLTEVLLALLLLFSSLPGLALSGFIQTRDGRVIEGKIVCTSNAFLVVRSGVGDASSPVTVPLSAITLLKLDAPAPTTAAAARGHGNGLLGCYYPGTNLTGSLFTRLDQSIDFDWGRGEPLRGVPRTSYSVIWMGEVEPPASGLFTFYIATDGVGRLLVNERPICETAQRQVASKTNGTVELRAGERARLRFEYVSFFGDAHVRLLWSGPETPKTIIPKERLFAASFLPEHPAEISGERGLLGTFYRNSDFTGPTFTRITPMIDFTGDEGALAPNFSPNNCSVRWRGQVQTPASEVFTFYLISDEWSRLCLDHQLLIERAEGGVGESRENVPLRRGERYDIEVEARNTGGGLVTRLLWSSASVPKAVVAPGWLTPSRPARSPGSFLEGSITQPRGIALRNGTFIAGGLRQSAGSVLDIECWRGSLRVSTVNAARLQFREVSLSMLQHVPPARSGVLLRQGNFIDGEFRGLQGNRVQISSVLLGTRSYEVEREALAVILRGVEVDSDLWEVQLRDGTVLRAAEITVAPEGLMACEELLGPLRIPFNALAALRGK